ncbi:MAG TPA: ribonuclease Z [Oribacterium sp.]|nr:ribonuclease Z [Oribacterium sp.]
MRFTSIASGSSGNSSYIGTDHTHVLVDAGVTMKAINQGLHALDLDLSDVQAIFLTHEHIDHIRAIGTISRKYQIPVYGTLGTLQEVMLNRTLGDFSTELLQPILPDAVTTVGDLQVTPFSIDHDAADPVGYCIEAEGKRVAVATDLGHYDDYIVSHLEDLDAMVVEANHDVRMLSTGPYPMTLKRRILSDHGHLSNESSGHLIDRILNSRVKHVFLGHLSKENNLPELALKTVQQEINASESEFHAVDFDITVAKRDGISEIVEL